MDDGATDAVLEVLSRTEEPLTTDEVFARVGPGRALREVRVALRDLVEQGDVTKLGQDKWQGVGIAARPRETVTHEGCSGRFTEDELRRARHRYGATKDCPRCSKTGDIDAQFGWRRMRREDHDIVPQSWCFDCRFVGKE